MDKCVILCTASCAHNNGTGYYNVCHHPSAKHAAIICGIDRVYRDGCDLHVCVDHKETVDTVNGNPIIEFGGLTPLYGGDPACHHEIVRGNGIKCRKCGGWYCA